MRDRLRDLGHRARCVNVSAFDVWDSEGVRHYLSGDEARALSTATLSHPAPLREFGELRGLNYWYAFPQALEAQS